MYNQFIDTDNLIYRYLARLAPVLKHIFINVSYHILVASLTLMALFKEPSELDWLHVYDMKH